MRSLLPLLVLAYFIIGVLMYAAATPIFESPDEASHFLYAHNLYNTGQLPILEDRATVFASRAVQRHHPPLYYLIGSLLLTGTTRDDLPVYLIDNPFAHYGTIATSNANVLMHPLQPPPGDTMQAAWRLRVLSLLFACGTLWCIYRVGYMAFGRSVGLLAMFIAASIPSFVSISGSINNDNAVTFFYSAGIAWAVWVWQKRTILLRDMVIIGAILAGAALSKITGLTLMGVIGLVLLVGFFTGRFAKSVTRQTDHMADSLWLVVKVGLVAGLCVGGLAGWWYLRNLQLYGDSLALAATNTIWGRSAPTDPRQVMSEAWGVWESFWLVLGHFNVRGPNWLYPTVTVMSVMGSVGILVTFYKGMMYHAPTSPAKTSYSYILILLSAIGIIVAALIVATRSINVSQGRILFPALAAFCPLLALGLGAWGRWAVWGIVPLVIAHLITPFAILGAAFALPRPITSLPDDVIAVQAEAEGLRLLGYRIEPDTMTPDDSVRLRMYIQGQHPADPALYLKIVDPLTLVPIGGVDVYPGMTPSSQFDPNQIYEVAFTLPINRARLTGLTPRRLDLVMGWRLLGDDPINDVGTPLLWTLADGTQSDGLRVEAATLVDPDYKAPVPVQTVGVVYGDALELVGYTVAPPTVSSGQSVSITLVWRSIGPLSDDWTLALGLLDSEGHVIAQADGPLPGYPTSVWRTGVTTEDTRSITIPVETAPGDLRLFIGWYRPTDANQRLTAEGPGIDNDLYLSPPVVTVK